MAKIYEGQLALSNSKIVIIAAKFNDFIVSSLLGGAKECLKLHGHDEKNLSIAFVPGAFEIPLIAKKFAETKKYDAIICLGAVIRGETPHFDYVCAESAKGISKVSLDFGIPVLNGILTTDTTEQAMERAGIKAGNKGFDVALASISMINLIKEIK